MLIIPYSTHIHTLYIYVDSSFYPLREDAEKYAAGILSTCKQLVTLGLYYYYGVCWSMVSREVIFLAEQGKLTHLGIYSRHLLEGRSIIRSSPQAVNSLIISLAQSPLARKSIKTLELAINSISMDAFTTILSSFPSLQSLTFRKAIGMVPWISEDWKHWTPYRGLKRLQLTKCEMDLLIQIRSLLYLFPALTELLVSGRCYRRGGTGWNQYLDMPHHTQSTLELLHVENMSEWEMREMVKISATVLVVAAVQLKYTLNILRETTNPFPGLKILRIEPPEHHSSILPLFCDLEKLCKAMDVSVRTDASPIFSLNKRNNWI
jgi:hypothetical protein